MGKSKNKKQKQPSEIAQSIPTAGLDLDALTVKAIDGHNTTGWTDNEVKAYNDLIAERQKLERQRHELEEKCAKSQTQRALLHENVANIDSLFKQQKTMSPAFKFTGASTCCVDLDPTERCQHEICQRAKKEGVTDVELDAIKYYSMRIHAEKSERIRNALRKQRDLELIRIKREEDEGQAQTAKKTSKKTIPNHGDATKSNGRISRNRDMTRAAKETEKIVNKIITQLDDLRSDLQTGRISAEEAQGKLNILDSKLPLMQDKADGKAAENATTSLTSQDLKSTTDSFQDHLRDRLLSAKGDTFSQAFSIMNHFLSATKPDDLQEAISELKDVLQLTGPMCDELQSSLGALEGIFDSPEKLSFTGPDGKQECTSIIDLMEKLKETLNRTGQLPDGANASLTKVFQECIDLEAEAKEKLTLKCSEENITNSGIPPVLIQIKDEYVAKSPIPPLTSNKLDSDIANLLDVYDARQLFAKASAGAEAAELEAQITALVIARTQRKSAKYIEKLERLQIACRSAVEQDGQAMVQKAVVTVLEKMKKWIPGMNAKKQEQGNTDNKVNEQLHSSPGQSANPIGVSTKALQKSANKSVPDSWTMAREAQRVMRASIEEHGLWQTFQVHCEGFNFPVDTLMLEKVDGYKEKTRALIEDKAYGMQSAISYLYKLKLCPSVTAGLISTVMLEIAKKSEDNSQMYMKHLTGCIGGLPASMSLEWSNNFRHLVLAMTQAYIAIYVETMAMIPRASPSHCAASVMTLLTRFVVLTRTTSASQDNLRLVSDFLIVCYAQDTWENSASLADVFDTYHRFATNDRFRCMTTGPCTKHMSLSRMPFTSDLPQMKVLPKWGAKSEIDPNQDLVLGDDGGLVGSALRTMTKPSAGLQASKDKIVPMKTTVWYPPHRQRELQPQIPKRRRDVRFAESLKQAAILSGYTARRARTLLRLRMGDQASQPSLPSTEVLSAMNDILKSTNRQICIPANDVPAAAAGGAIANSKFSEDFDDKLRSTELAIKSALNIQTVFKQLRNGTLGNEYLDLVKDSIQARAMSGRYPNPVEAVTGFARSLSKVGRVPDLLAETLVKTQAEIQTMLEDSNEWFACETRRLRHLLGKVDADKPSASAILQLAMHFPSSFHEYHDIMFDKLEEIETVEIGLLEESWADVTQLAKTLKLKLDSPSLFDFVQLAIDDWSNRPRTITKYIEESEEDAYLNDNDDDVEDGIFVRGLASSEGRPPVITHSSARRPVVEKQSQEAAVIPSCAPIFSPIESLVSRGTKIHEEAQLMHPEYVEQMNGPVRRMSAMDCVADTEVNQERRSSLPGASATIDGGLALRFMQNGNIHDIISDQMNLISGVEQLVSAEGSDDQTRQDVEPQYLLPNTDRRTMGALQAASPQDSSTTPASFRMLDMMKHMTALQTNSRDLFETAQEISQFNKEHGSATRGLADKVAGQVTVYGELVTQIMEWNGIEMATEGSEHSQQRKGKGKSKA